MNFDKNLEDLFIELPGFEAVKKKSALSSISGNLLYISSMLPFSEGRIMEKGRVGIEVGLDRAKLAAKQACLWAVSAVSSFCDGTLNKVSKIVLLDLDIACGIEFVDHEKIADSACELLENIFKGTPPPARRIRGVSSLSQNSVVQAGLVVELK